MLSVLISSFLLLQHSTTYSLNSSFPMQSKGISGYGNYLCFVYLSRNEIIISWASVDGVEFERLVGCKQTCSSLVQTSASSLVLVQVTGSMTRAHLWYIIGTGQGYCLDDKGAPLGCYWVNDERLTPTSHCYTRVVARWLEFLASYAGQPNLTGIMSGMVLERFIFR